MFTQPTINLCILKSNPNRHGLHNIYLQFTLNRKINRIALGQFIRKKDWIDKGGKYVREAGGDPRYNGRLMNILLSDLVGKANRILLEMQTRGEPITFQAFKASFKGHKAVDFFEYLETFIERKRKLGYSEHTISTYVKVGRKMKTYQPNLFIHEINTDFLKKLETYFKIERGNAVNTIWTFFKCLRSIILQAIEDKIITASPFDDFKLTYVNHRKPFLTHDDLDRLWKLYFDPELAENLRNTLKQFLFACHTGLDFNDINQIDYKEIFIQEDKTIISRERKKTGTHYVVSVPERALCLIEKGVASGKVFKHVLSNQKTNKNLKRIIEQAGIQKRITFHIARHTFGTLSLNLGIPQEVVQKMMGHTKSDMTKHYAKVQTNYIVKQMDKWNDQK